MLKFENLEPKAAHDFSVWIQQPEFLSHIRRTEGDLKKKGTRRVKEYLLKEYQLLFNSKSKFRKLFATTFEEHLDQATTKKISSLADAYWDKLIYESDLFIEGRMMRWPDSVCQHARDLLPLIAPKKISILEINKRILEQCQGPYETIKDVCKDYLAANPESDHERDGTDTILTCRLFSKKAKKGCLFKEFKDLAPLIADCEAGMSQGCKQLAEEYAKADHYPRGYVCLPKPEVQRRLMEKYCIFSEESICTKLGYMKLSGEGGDKDDAGARDAFSKACLNTGYSPYGKTACLALGRMYAEGIGGQRDIEKAKTLFTELCEKNRIEGCMYLAKLEEKKRHNKKRMQSCINRYSQRRDHKSFSCPVFVKTGKAGNQWAYHSAGILATRTSADTANAEVYKWGMRMLKRGCDAGFARSCGALADVRVNRRAGAREDLKAYRLYRKGCELGDEPSCEESVRMCERGKVECNPDKKEPGKAVDVRLPSQSPLPVESE